MERKPSLALIEEALAQGAEAAEVYQIEQETHLVDMKEGKIDTLSRGHQMGIGLRVLEKQRMGFAFCTSLGEETLSDLADRALTAARQSHPDPFLLIPPPSSQPYPQVDGYDGSLGEMNLGDRAEFALRMERAAKAVDSRVSKVRHSLYQDANYSVLLLNSRGLEATSRGTYCSASVYVVAEGKGASETGWDMQSSSFFSDLSGEEVGRRAAEQATMMLGAKTIPTHQVDAIFSPAPASEFLEVLSVPLMADAVQKGKSLFANRMATQVSSRCLNLIDDGLLPHGPQSFPFDDEGIPGQKTPLIESGVLKGFLYDSYCAAKEEKTSTGNARRGGFQSPPQIRVTNLLAVPGKRAPEAMMRDMEKGVLILSLMGMHTANPISGDFSVGAEGLWIEGGKVQHPFRGVIIAGNLRDWLESLEEVGSDLRFFGGVGCPSLRLKGLQLAGA
jgi:PmbA protein